MMGIEGSLDRERGGKRKGHQGTEKLGNFQIRMKGRGSKS